MVLTGPKKTKTLLLLDEAMSRVRLANQALDTTLHVYPKDKLRVAHEALVAAIEMIEALPVWAASVVPPHNKA